MDHYSRVKDEFKRQAETLSVSPAFTDAAAWNEFAMRSGQLRE